MNNKSNINLYLLLLVAFLEGASVMIIELLGAKIIAPFYGASLYVRSSVLGVTLLSLAIGYYLGGVISTKTKKDYYLTLILFIGSIFVILAPNTAPFLMEKTLGLGVRLGSFVSVLFYLSPSIICMGMVSPIITQSISFKSSNAGHSAGKVYAISTLGGILATFVAGFYLIPNLGISNTSLLTGGILLLSSLIILIKQKRKAQSVISVIVFTVIASQFYLNNTSTSKADDTIVRYQSSGILGEWTVVDKLAAIAQGDKLYTRQLLLNGVDQTYTQVGNEPVSMWFYPHKIAALAGLKPPKSKALLLGMGGGSIAHNLLLLGFDLDIVELDQRIPNISEKWFDYEPDSANLIIDDARHYFRFSDKKYDLVIMDMVNGEVQPSHVFTQEGIKNMRDILNDDALVIINFQGRIDQKKPSLSLGPLSVLKTFQSVDFNMFLARQEEQENTSLSDDMLIYGTPKSFKFKDAFNQGIRYNEIFPFVEFSPQDFEEQTGYSLNDALVFTDDKPNLEIVNAPTILVWRENKIKFIMDGLLANDIQLFK